MKVAKAKQDILVADLPLIYDQNALKTDEMYHEIF